jgi:hypothetical protein
MKLTSRNGAAPLGTSLSHSGHASKLLIRIVCKGMKYKDKTYDHLTQGFGLPSSTGVKDVGPIGAKCVRGVVICPMRGSSNEYIRRLSTGNPSTRRERKREGNGVGSETTNIHRGGRGRQNGRVGP